MTMNRDQQASRGQQAEQLLENPAFKDAMQHLKDQILKKWRSCPIRDQEGQLLLLQMHKMADQFEDLLHAYVRAGRDAVTRIDLDRARNETKTEGVLRRGFGMYPASTRRSGPQ